MDLAAGVITAKGGLEMPSRTVVFVPKEAVLRDVAEFLVRISATVDSCLPYEDGVDLVFNVDHARMSTIGDAAQSFGFTMGGRTNLVELHIEAVAEEKPKRRPRKPKETPAD
jgi:hypothetical protein